MLEIVQTPRGEVTPTRTDLRPRSPLASQG